MRYFAGVGAAVYSRCGSGESIGFLYGYRWLVWTAGDVPDGFGAFHRTPFLDIPEREY